MPSTPERRKILRRLGRDAGIRVHLSRNANIIEDAEARAYREAAIEALREAKRRGGGMVRVER